MACLSSPTSRTPGRRREGLPCPISHARFPAGPFAIASKFDVPVVFVYALKETANHYHLYCTAPKVYKNKQEEMMDDYVSNLERMTRKYPEQWFNYFDFWKKPV